MRVVATVEVEVVVEVPTRNTGLGLAAVVENWDNNWKHYVKPPWSHAALHGRAVRFRVEEETGGKR